AVTGWFSDVLMRWGEGEIPDSGGLRAGHRRKRDPPGKCHRSRPSMSALPLQFGGSFPLPINAGGLAGGLFGKRKGRTPKAEKPSKISQPADRSAAARQSAAKANAQSARAEQMVDKRSDEQLLADYIDGERDAFPILMGRYADELV